MEQLDRKLGDCCSQWINIYKEVIQTDEEGQAALLQRMRPARSDTN